MPARRRSQRRILEGAAVASILSGAPSTVHALLTTRSARRAGAQALHATREIGTLLPPGRPGLVRGAVGHLAISLAVAELLGVALPREHSRMWGALAGGAVGVVGLRVVAPRRAPALAALPLVPQLADNVAFGVVLASLLDR